MRATAWAVFFSMSGAIDFSLNSTDGVFVGSFL